MSTLGLFILLEDRLGRLSSLGRELRHSLTNPTVEDLRSRIEQLNVSLSAANTAYLTLASQTTDQRTIKNATTLFNIAVAEVSELASNLTCVISVLEANLKHGI